MMGFISVLRCFISLLRPAKKAGKRPFRCLQMAQLNAHERQLKIKNPAKIFCYSRKFLGKTNQI